MKDRNAGKRVVLLMVCIVAFGFVVFNKAHAQNIYTNNNGGVTTGPWISAADRCTSFFCFLFGQRAATNNSNAANVSSAYPAASSNQSMNSTYTNYTNTAPNTYATPISNSNPGPAWGVPPPAW